MIYVVRCEGTGLRKIGIAGNVEARVSSLQVGSASKLSLELVAEGGRAEEMRLHETFADRRIRGEWFRVEVAEVEAIDWLSFVRVGAVRAEKFIAETSMAIGGDAIAPGPNELDVIMELKKSPDERIATAAHRRWLAVIGRDIHRVEHWIKQGVKREESRVLMAEHARRLGGRVEWQETEQTGVRS